MPVGKSGRMWTCSLKETVRIKRATKVLFKQVTTRENHANLSVYLYVPENMEEFQQDVTFQDRKTKEQYTMDDNGGDCF